MQPKIVNISERDTLGRNNVIEKSIVVTYTVGNFGPFTLITNSVDLKSGKALAEMQDFANTLQMLPTGS